MRSFRSWQCQLQLKLSNLAKLRHESKVYISTCIFLNNLNPNQDTLFLFYSPNVVKNQINHSSLKEKSMTHKALIYLQGWDSKQQGIFLVIVVFFWFPGSAFPTIFHSLDVWHKAKTIRTCINKVCTLKSAVYICSKNIQTPLNDCQHISR